MTALIETVRVRDGVAPLWSLHMRRLERSASELHMTLPELPVPRGGDDRIIRYEIAADGGWQVSERDVPPEQPVALATSPAPHRGYPHKVSDRGWLEAARLTVQQLGADDALMLDSAGAMVEATICTVAWWEEELLTFPPLELGGLPGVGRARLAETARGGIREAVIRREELSWRSLVVCNAARGLIPVHSLDGEPVPANFRTPVVADRFWRRRSG
ncbi:MAG TPA: aminotransferase class IV [Gemmatimonadales bacterium]|nr:aminotransferase class IV [Gemmatimonadales bacterium]